MIKGSDWKVPLNEVYLCSVPALNPPERVVEVPLSRQAKKTIASTTYVLMQTPRALPKRIADSFLGIETKLIMHYTKNKHCQHRSIINLTYSKYNCPEDLACGSIITPAWQIDSQKSKSRRSKRFKLNKKIQ